MPPLRVCFFGTYRSNYSRNQIMLSGLRANGAVVFECHQRLWQGIEDRVEQALGGWRNPQFWWRLLKCYVHLFRQHRHVPEYDVMLIGYPGQFDTFLGRILSWWRRKPMVLDLYMSLYLIALERGLVARSPVSGSLIRRAETVGLRLPNVIISDTAEYVQFHCRTYGLNPDRFRLVSAGADDRIFYPRHDVRPPDDCFRVIYAGTFIPNHGVLTMIEAIALLDQKGGMRFDFFGDGPDAAAAGQLAQSLGLDKVRFHGWIAKEELPREMAASHLCLGVFGETQQSMITVQNKIWEAAAMRLPLVTGDSPTVRAAFKDRQEIYLVERANPRALAAAIQELAWNPELRTELAEGAYRRFVAGNTIEAIGRVTSQVLTSLLSPEKRPGPADLPDGL